MAHASEAASTTLTDFKPETLRGTPGFFRVGQTRRGQWWLIDSRDRPFLSKGVASVNRFGRADGRSVPVGPYAATVDKLYGAKESEAFARAALARLEKWHVNTLGPWTGPEFLEQGLACVEVLDFRKFAPEINAFGAKLPDVFDLALARDVRPRWRPGCARRGASRASSSATLPTTSWAGPGARGKIAGGSGGEESPPVVAANLPEPRAERRGVSRGVGVRRSAARGGSSARITLARAWQVTHCRTRRRCASSRRPRR